MNDAFISRRSLAACAGILMAMHCAEAYALSLPRFYLSPRNSERPVRARTDFIILHTTEGPATGSLRKLSDNGEANYMIDEQGRLYRIIRHDKVAFHSGRSMWSGQNNLDFCSVGIEVVGTYCGSLTSAQYKTLASLLKMLQDYYHVPDSRVLTHSMVAYSTPNKWFKRSHRGRKRCGMLFANPMVRQRLGLTSQPAFDPDVRAGRLVQADPYLASKLYRGTTSYAASVAAARPAPPSHVEDESDNDSVREIGKDGLTAIAVAGDDYNKPSTFYFFPSGAVKSGNAMSFHQLQMIPTGTKVLVGYTYGGRLTADRNAYAVCGRRWHFPSTIYRFPDGRIRPGNAVDDNSIPPGTMVFYLE